MMHRLATHMLYRTRCRTVGETQHVNSSAMWGHNHSGHLQWCPGDVSSSCGGGQVTAHTPRQATPPDKHRNRQKQDKS